MSKTAPYCSYCGHQFLADADWPRRCAACERVSYINPLPVACLLLPVANGILTVRRALNPGKGQLALPGGFIEVGESWEAAAARELFEETGIQTAVDEIELFRVLSPPMPDQTILIFGIAAHWQGALPPLPENHPEVDALVVVDKPQPLAFDLHTMILAQYFAERML